MRVLCYIRPWTAAYFRFLADALAEGDQVYLISEHRECDRTGLIEDFYSNYRTAAAGDFTGITREQADDVIRRCRLLRDLPAAESHRHIAAMYTAICKVLDRAAPDIVLSMMVDSYILDLLAIAADQRGVPFVGTVQSFINGYYRLTTRGEMVLGPAPDDSQCHQVLNELLDDQYKPRFLVDNGTWKNLVLRRLSRETVKYIYASLRALGPDPLNYHWRSTARGAKRTANPGYIFGARQISADWESRLRSSSVSVAYIPLQYFPEATVDYWVPDPYWLDYESRLLEVIEYLGQRYTVAVKEHPAMMGMRDPSFYRRILRTPGALLIPHSVPSNRLVERADATLVWTGSAGFEARLRLKPTVAFGRPYYARPDHFIFPATVGDVLPALADEIDRLTHASDDSLQQQRFEMVRYLLSGLLPGQLRYLVDPGDRSERAEALRVAQSLHSRIRFGALHNYTASASASSLRAADVD